MTIVSGLVIDSSGDPVPGAVIEIAPPRRAAFARPGGTQVPAPLTAVADGSGLITFDALPGLMIGEIRDGARKWPVELRVPDQSMADLADCLEAGGGELPPASVVAAQIARDGAEAARDVAVAAAGGGAGGVAIEGGAFLLDAAQIESDDTLSYTTHPAKRAVSAGDVVQCIKQGWSYTVLALGATGAHRTTAGGVLLRANPSNGSLLPGQFGAKGDYNFTTQVGTDDTLALQRMFAYADVNRIPVYIPAGNYLYSGQLCNMVSGFDLAGVGKDAVFIKSDSYTGEAFHINFPIAGGMLGTFGSTVGGDTSAKNYHATGGNSWSGINVVGQSRATAGTAFKVSGVLDLFKFDDIGVFNIRGSALVFGGYKGTVRECIFSRWKVRNCGSAEAPVVWYKTDVERGRATVSGTTVTLTSGSFAPIRSFAGPRKIRVMGTAASTTPELTISSFASDTVATISAAPAIDVADADAIWYNDFDGQNNVTMSNFDVVMSYGKALVISCERVSTLRRFALNDMLIHGHGVMPDGDGGDLITFEGAVGYVTSRNLRTNSPEQKDGLKYASIRFKPGPTITTDRPTAFDLDVHLNNLSAEGEGHIVIEAMGSGRISGVVNTSSSAHISELIVQSGAITSQLVYEVRPVGGRASAPADLLQIADDQKTKVLINDPTTAYAASAMISAGAVTLPDGITSLTIDTEGASATDDLETITPGANIRPGHVVVLKSQSSARDITVKHGLGNVRLTASADAILSTTTSRIALQWDGIWLNQVGASFSIITPPVQRITTSANGVLATPTAGADVVMIDGPLTRDVVYALSSIGATSGMKRRITRNAAGSYTWTAQVSGGRVVAVLTAAGQWVDVVFDGTSWYPDASGTLTLSSGGTATAPDQVTGVAASTGAAPGQIVATWSVPVDGGSAITGYQIARRTGGGSWVTSTVGAVTSATLSGLTPGAAYDVTVAAINAVGTGTASAIATATAKAAATYSVAIGGLTNNATWGPTPQFGTTLTANVTGLTGGETVSYEWREGTVARASGSTLALTSGGSFGDGQDLTLAVIIDGTEYLSSTYKIRFAPPTALASLADVTGTEGDASLAIDVAAVFAGSGLSYFVDTNSIGASIDAVSGQATQLFNAPFSATTVTYRARNSGGEVTRAHTVTCAAIVLGDLAYQATAIIRNTAAPASNSGTLPTYADATGTLVYVTTNTEVSFTVTVGGVAATLVGLQSAYKDSGVTFRTGCSVYYAPVGNGTWTLARADGGTATLSIYAVAIQVKGGTLRNFRPNVYGAHATGTIINASLAQAWRSKDLLLSSVLCDGSDSKLPSGGFAQLIRDSMSAGSVEIDIDHLVQAADGSATFTYSSGTANKTSFGWMILDCSQYPAVVARPGEPPTSGYIYGLNLARTSATIAVSGTYSGPAADIYERVVNEDGLEVVPWTLIQAGATGNVYSGSLTIPVAGLKTLYREARKGTDGFSVKRQLAGFMVGMQLAQEGQSNGSVFAVDRSSAATRHPKTLVYNAYGDGAGFKKGTETGNGAISMLNELVALSGIPWAYYYGFKGGSQISAMSPGTDVYAAMSTAISGLTGALHAAAIDQGEGDGSSATPRTAAQWMGLVDQIHVGFAGLRGQARAELPFVYCSISTYGKTTDPYNNDTKWGNFREAQKDAQALAPGKFMLNRINMVRSTAAGEPADPYHADPRSMEAYGRLLARTIWKQITGIGTLPVFKIATATRVDASTIDLTFENSLSADWKVQRLPSGEGTGYPIDITGPAQGFAVTADGWATSIPCTVAKTGTNSARLTQATPNASANTLSHAWGMQGANGQTPPTIQEGLLVEVSAEAYPLMFERAFPVT